MDFLYDLKVLQKERLNTQPTESPSKYTTQRIRIDCVSVANHNLIRLLDKPDIGTQVAINRKYLFLRAIIVKIT